MDYLFITDSDFANTDSSFQYLLGFQPSLGAMLLSDTTLTVMLDGGYFQKTSSISINHIREILENPELEVRFIQSSSMSGSVIEAITGIHTLGLQNSIAIKYIQDIQNKLPKITLSYHDDYFRKKRMIKMASEKKSIKRAVRIIDDTFIYIQDTAQKGELHGKTELQVRSMILQRIFSLGGTGESFDSIVAFGPNSAIPHHVSGETVIADGPLLIDMGAKYQGYCSDFTRTFWIGEKSEGYKKFQQVYDIVKDAYNAGVSEYKRGYTGADLDAAAREVIQKTGYEDYFIHSLGHSLGIDIHEPPRMSSEDDTVLEQGMVFTIEPGIYLPGEFGVRIENIVFLENDILNTYTNIPL